MYFFSFNQNDNLYVYRLASMLLPIAMLTSYFMIYFVIPKYLLTKRYFFFGLYSFYTLIFSTYLVVVVILFSFFFLSDLQIKNMPPMSKNYVFLLILVYLVVAIVSTISLLRRNFKALSVNKELEKKILETQLQSTEQELTHLKRQIHPHFLFNTLNTIYGFAMKQSAETPELILKLSNLLDYILYQVQKPQVKLQDEVFHIREYIQLEKLRFQDSLKVQMHEHHIDPNTMVPPMLFIPFVENAFKHGSIVQGYLSVEICFELEANQLLFMIKNSVKEKNTYTQSNGIGLENIKKRLELLYKGHYELLIQHNQNHYKVSLTLNLAQSYDQTHTMSDS